MNFDYVSLRRLERFFTDLKAWLSSKYATKEPMKGATAQSAGEAGLVPAPAVADKDKYLKGDGTWGTVPEAEKNYSYVWDGSPTGEVNGMFHVTVNRDLSGYSSAQRSLTQVGRNGALGYLLPEAVDDTIPVGITDAGNHKTYALKTPAQLGLLSAATPTSSDANKVLIVDQNGTPGWNLLNSMTGSTASAAGTAGLVPAPAAGDQDKVLKGDGTWGDAPSTMRVAYDSANMELQLDFSPLIWKETIGTKQYRVKKYGSKIWMIENYNEPVTTYSSLYPGDTDGSVYGRLYGYTTDLSALGVSQSGWRLPTQTDWLDLVEEITGTRPSMNGRALHPEWLVLNEHWTAAWTGDNINKSGFSVLPSGYRNSDGIYDGRGVYAQFYGEQCRVSVSNSAGDPRVMVEYLATTAPRYSLRFCKDA